MKTNTLKKLIKNSNIPAALIRAVVRQIGGWENFVNAAPDIANHGIDGGFHGFIYYTDTLSFAKRNRAYIQALANEQAADFGSSVVEMIQNFGCFRNNKPTESEICTALYGGRSEDGTRNVLNALAWYAGEEVARAFQDLTEND